VPLNPGDHFTLPLTVRMSTYQPLRGMLGWLIVTEEDANGEPQADMVPVGHVPH